MNIPTGHQAVMPYLILNGASKFIDFTQKVFDAKLISTHLRDDQKTIMHAEIGIDGSTIMLAEATEQFPPQNAHLFVYVEDADKSFQAAKDNGAEVMTELSDQDYGRTCGVTDPTGNVWWITSLK
jgi:PhnB protein